MRITSLIVAAIIACSFAAPALAYRKGDIVVFSDAIFKIVEDDGDMKYCVIIFPPWDISGIRMSAEETAAAEEKCLQNPSGWTTLAAGGHRL